MLFKKTYVIILTEYFQHPRRLPHISSQSITTRPPQDVTTTFTFVLQIHLPDRSLSVWSSVKFYCLEWCHWKLTVLLKLPLSCRIWQNTYVLLHSAEDQLNVMVYVWISKIIIALDFSPLQFRKPCTVLYLIWSLQQVREREDRDYYLYFTDTVLSVCSNWRGLGYHP